MISALRDILYLLGVRRAWVFNPRCPCRRCQEWIRPGGPR